MHHEQEFDSHPRPQFLAKAGTGYFTGKAKDCQRDGHPELEGWYRTQNRQRNNKNVVWEEISKLTLNN